MICPPLPHVTNGSRSQEAGGILVRRESYCTLDANLGRSLTSFGGRLGWQYIFQAQYQQAPVSETGNIIKRDWIRHYDTAPDRSTDTAVVQSWDTAMKGDQIHDYLRLHDMVEKRKAITT